MNRAALCAVGAAGVVCVAGSLSADVIPNDIVIHERIFNDYPSSRLVITNNYPDTVVFDEDQFGAGGFANRHSAYFSTDGGATDHDFGYHDGFDLGFLLETFNDPPVSGREAGFHTDLFGFGFFGPLPHNGEIAAFGSILPFHSFGNGLWTPNDGISLRMIYRPGDGDGVNPLPPGGDPSTIEYLYDLRHGGGWVSSGQIPFTNLEGGIPENFSFLVGFGVQNQGALGGKAVARFRKFDVPAPAAGALGLMGVLALARRRR